MPTFGKVVAQFMTAVVDASDPDQFPDLVPLIGSVTFTLNVGRIVETDAEPNPYIIGSTAITGILDSEGYLCTPNPSNPLAAGTRGIYLIATDDASLNPTAFQYAVTYKLTAPDTRPRELPTHNIALLAGTTIDLAMVIPPASAPAIGTAAAEAAAAAAAASAAAAVQYVIVATGNEPRPVGGLVFWLDTRALGAPAPVNMAGSDIRFKPTS